MRPIFIGDELTAAGYRLAGVEVRTPPAGEELAMVREAIEAAPPLVLVTRSIVQQWSHAQRVEVLGAVAPPVLPVGDAAGDVDALDLVGWIRSRIIA